MPRETRITYEQATHTRALVSFHTDQDNGLNIGTPVRSHPRLGKIIHVSTRKSLGSASGTFTIRVKKDRDALGPNSALRAPPHGWWRDPEDVWVKIKWQVDGQIIDGMLGMIDSVREITERTGGGQRSETYEITGRDFGKVFEVTEVFVNLFHAPGEPIQRLTSLLDTWLENLIGTPAHFVRVLIEAWIGNYGAAEAQFTLPPSLGGTAFDSILSKAGIEDMCGSVNGLTLGTAMLQIDQSGGKLWDLMQEYANGVMNELYVDLAPNALASSDQGRDLEDMVPTVFLRERPFPIRSDDGRTTNNTKWNGLTTHTLALGDVRTRGPAKGGASNRFNYWTIHLQGVGTEGFNVQEILQRGIDGVENGVPGNIPIWSNGSISKHGVRRYMAQTRFIPFYAQGELAQEDRENFFRLSARWLKKCHDWFAIAPFELSGQISTTRLQPEIRIGHRVREVRNDENIVYYVEEVENSYDYGDKGPRSSTTLTLTRGEYENDDLLDFIYEEYENGSHALSGPENCFVDAATGILDSQELFDQLARGCTFRVPNVGEGDPTSTGVGEITDDVGGHRVLEAERDGTCFRNEDPDALAAHQQQTTLDDTEPTVGDTDAIPPPGETEDAGRRPGEPAVDQASVEQGAPIDDGFDDSNDPLFGLTETELGGF